VFRLTGSRGPLVSESIKLTYPATQFDIYIYYTTCKYIIIFYTYVGLIYWNAVGTINHIK